MSKSKKQYPVLEYLFNSRARVKVLRYLFRNYPVNISARELAKKTQEPLDVVKKELQDMKKINLVIKYK